MYIKDNIAYADDDTFEVLVESVEACDDYTLVLDFNTGEVKRFDFKPILEFPAFEELKDLSAFKAAQVKYGTVVWNDRLDYAPETLYAKSVLL